MIALITNITTFSLYGIIPNFRKTLNITHLSLNTTLLHMLYRTLFSPKLSTLTKLFLDQLLKKAEVIFINSFHQKIKEAVE